MPNLLVDMLRLSLAPTLKRELLAQLVNLIVIAPLLFFVTDNPALQYSLLALVVAWVVIRVSLVATRSKKERNHDKRSSSNVH